VLLIGELMRKNSGERRVSGPSKRLFIRKDKEGVASTVGTIMALLVFLALLGVFTNSYVPLWMLDNERVHMNEVMNQFGEFKSKIDNLIIGAQITGESGINMYTPITLGSDGVPVFASPTFGQLTFSPYTVNSTGVSISFHAKGESNPTYATGGGSLELYSPNRYFEQQWVQYENGAILIKQVDGQTMRAIPSIEVTGGDRLSLSFTQIDLLGTSSTVAGAGSVGVNINLEYLDVQTYDISDTDHNITITFTTTYGEAWHNFLNNICIEEGIDYSLSDLTGDEVQEIEWTLYNCGTLHYNRAYLTIGVEV